MRTARCALCNKPLSQRQSRILSVEMPYLGKKYATHSAHKDCAGIYKEYTNLKDKEKRNKIEFEIIKARIAKAAGHGVSEDGSKNFIKFATEITFGTNPIPQHYNCKSVTFPRTATQQDQIDAANYAIYGTKARQIIIDDLECDITYDKEVLNKIWMQIDQANDNQLKGAINATNAANNGVTHTNGY